MGHSEAHVFQNGLQLGFDMTLDPDVVRPRVHRDLVIVHLQLAHELELERVRVALDLPQQRSWTRLFVFVYGQVVGRRAGDEVATRVLRGWRVLGCGWRARRCWGVGGMGDCCCCRRRCRGAVGSSRCW